METGNPLWRPPTGAAARKRHLRRYLRERLRVLFGQEEVDVALGDQSDELPSEQPRVRDRDAGETVLLLRLDDIEDAIRRRHDDWIGDETLLVLL